MTVSANHSRQDGIEDPVLGDLMDELAGRFQAGAPLDVESVVRAHPQYAEQLRRLLPAMQVLAGLERSLGQRPAAAGPGEACAGEVLGTLGDFRLLREWAAAAWASSTRRNKSRYGGGWR